MLTFDLGECSSVLMVDMSAALGGRCRVSAALMVLFRLRDSGEENPGPAACRSARTSGLARLDGALEVGSIRHVPPHVLQLAAEGVQHLRAAARETNSRGMRSPKAGLRELGLGRR